MSDYNAGYNGRGTVDVEDMAAYNRGQADRAAGLPPQGTLVDLPQVRDRARIVGVDWARDPDRTLAAMVKVLTGFTILGAVLGTVLGAVLGDAWTKTGAITWGVNFAYVAFWVVGFMIAAMLIGASLVKPTRRGSLVLAILLASLGYMLWTFVSWRMVS